MQRKLFDTDGIRGVANQYPIDPETMVKIGKAAAHVFKNSKKRHIILIGKDTRISGYVIESALTSGICSLGVDVLLVGPMPTPAIAHLTKSFAADAGIVISASHNPAEDNGIKFFSSDGFKLSDNKELEIEKYVFSKKVNTEQIKGELIGKAFRINDARGRYIEFAKNSIKNNSLSGLKVIVDCANGATYHIAAKIFKELGAEVTVLNNKPNGLNINLNCGALHPEVVREAVLKEKADIGISLDGDGDRVIMADEKGNIIDGDSIMAICGLHLLKKNKLKDNTIVATGYSNLALDELMKKNGGKVIRAQNGDRYVIDEMRKNSYVLGGEQSGHIIFMNQTTTGDGIIAALQVLNIMKKTGKPLSELAKCLKKYPQVLVNINVKKKILFEEMEEVNEEIKKAEKELKGRLLIRYSGTQNIARIMVEGKDKNKINKLANKIAEKIKKEIGV
ncbi:phosphoglucosamine mutase [Candidatus Woesearchaeota archaeon]|nr:phosphoglucosamine mutase [Candidatus Woesearchaeota archaeon]|tara:strand:- start:32089 stop:33435 length:1347 start_codon:yes stop_codon:yes gene_type:complete